MGYIGAGISRFNTADELTVTGDAEFNGNANFGDSDKAQFGAGSDLQIYHDSSNSYVKDAGTGDLLVQGTQIKLQDASGNDYLRGFTGGAVYLHHSGNTKFETTSSGVDVTGTVTADGLTVDQGSGGQGISLQRSGYDTMDIELSESGFRIRNETDGRTDLFIDGSGNVLVGKTSVDYTTVGFEATPSSSFQANAMTADGKKALLLARKSSDGDIVEFRKDSTVVGAIGSLSGRMFAGSGDVGVFFDSTNNMITPYSLDAGDTVDNTIDLGYSTRRFKNLYLSGGAYLGGTGSSNLLDDYEEGTWTPTASGGYTVSSSSGAYTKIGRVVHLWGTVQFSAVGGNTSTVVLGSAPFTNSTHLGTGVCRENTNTGAIYVFRIAPNSTSMEINTMTGVASGTRTIRTGENYAFHGSYYVA